MVGGSNPSAPATSQVAELSKSHHDLLSVLSIRTLSLIPSFHTDLCHVHFCDSENASHDALQSKMAMALDDQDVTSTPATESALPQALPPTPQLHIEQDTSADARSAVATSQAFASLSQDIAYCLQQLGVEHWQFSERDDASSMTEHLILPSLSHLQTANSKRILWHYLQQHFVPISE